MSNDAKRRPGCAYDFSLAVGVLSAFMASGMLGEWSPAATAGGFASGGIVLVVGLLIRHALSRRH